MSISLIPAENQKIKRVRFFVCVFCGNFNQNSQAQSLLLSHPKEGIFKVGKIILSILLIYCCVSCSKLYGLRQPIHFLPHSGYGSGIQKWLSGCICLWVSHNIAVRYLQEMLPSGCLIKAAGSASRVASSHAYKSIHFWQKVSGFPWWAFPRVTWMSLWYGSWLFLGWTIQDRERRKPQCYLT